MNGRVFLLGLFSFVCFVSSISAATQGPYNRYNGIQQKSGKYVPDKRSPEFPEGDCPDNFLINWLRQLVETDMSEELRHTFQNGTIPRQLKDIDQLADFVNAPAANESDGAGIPSIPLQPGLLMSPHVEASMLFSHLPYTLDPKCTNDKSKWYFRTIDGSCNWMEMNKISYGQIGTMKARDYNQHSFRDGISEPRDGPNPRAVSNAFFKRKQKLYYEHTPLLLGLIEFIMHDVTYSEDSTEEFIDIPMPLDEEDYPLNTTFRVWRSLPTPGSGTSRDNPRELLNQATTWLDVSSLYGSTRDVANALRSFKGGKLLSQKGGAQDPRHEYLPQNTMGLPMRTRQGVNASTLFAGGDPRTNEDWIMLAVHTLLLREHNRLCDILAKKHPEYDDERLYQTVRLILSAKFSLIANSYQMTYWTAEMPWPTDDGFPLYRQLYGENSLEINPAHSYPWPLVTKSGKPMVASAEMAIVYRFHEFIIRDFPIKDALNNTLRTQNLFSTAFDSKGFIDTGVEGILRGMLATHIPNFKSGVEEEFRSAGKYRGQPFDIATWSIVHEREQGLPTFNQYFRAYNAQDPAVVVPIRETFEDFSSDPEAVANLKRLYSSPDEVDLVVGVQLEEEMFPGTTVPKSSLIISLFSLFGLGNSDRFSVGYAMMRCFLVDKPWDCNPSNALEELLWAPKPTETHPNARFYDTFWLAELDFQAQGRNLLWRLVTENTDIKCLQRTALLPYDPVTNPILCAIPPQKPNYLTISYTAVEVSLALIRIHEHTILKVLGTLAIITFLTIRRKHQKFPPVMYGLPFIGEGLRFYKDPKTLLLDGFKKYGSSASRVFGIKNGPLTHFVVTQPRDMEAVIKDAEYDYHFSLHDFFGSINSNLIVGKRNFESDIHTKLIRKYLSDEKVLSGFTLTATSASESFLRTHPPVQPDSPSKHHANMNDYLTLYIIYVISRCIVGEDSFDNEELLKTFIRFDNDANMAMRFASSLPRFLKGLAGIKINRDFRIIRKILVPVIKRRRAGEDIARKDHNGSDLPSFLGFITPVVEDDMDVADLVTIVVWLGYSHLRSAFVSTFLDITNQPGLQDTLVASLAGATTQNIQVRNSSESSLEWNLLRSAMFESVRLAAPITSCARVITKSLHLPSQPTLQLPEKQVMTLSPFYTHRQPTVWGFSAADYQFDRFAKQDPPIGSTKYIAWGLEGPHMCPGRFFAQTTIQIMTKAIFERFVFEQDLVVAEVDKLVYWGDYVTWKAVGITAKRRVS